MLDGWQSWSGNQTFLPFHTRVWGWIAIAAFPLLFSLFRPQGPRSHRRRHRLCLALPWCIAHWTNVTSCTTLTALDSHRSQPRCLCARRRLLRLPHLVGRAPGQSRHSSTSASSASAQPSRGSTSVTSSTRWTARSASSASAFSFSPADGRSRRRRRSLARANGAVRPRQSQEAQ